MSIWTTLEQERLLGHGSNEAECAMYVDGTVYPDREPPSELTTDEEKGDYLHRICTAWDSGVLPE